RWRTLEPGERAESAAARGLAEGLVARRLSGDLDWITLKALAKDREQRYGSVADLAADIERHLRDEPVMAGPPTWRYLVGKFVRRRRWLVATSALALLGIVGGVVGTGIGLVRARDAARLEGVAYADAKMAVEFLHGLFSASKIDAQGVRRSPDEITARDLLEAGKATVEEGMADQPIVRARMRRVLAESYRALGLYRESLELLEAARQELEVVLPRGPNVREVQGRVELAVGKDYVTLARPEEALEVLESAEALISEIEASDRPVVLAAVLATQANALRSLARFDEARDRLRTALAMVAEIPGAEDQVMSLHSALAKTFFQQGQWSEAETHYRKAAELTRRVNGPVHMRTATVIDSLAAAIASQGRLDEAAPLFTEALEVRRSLLRDDHPGLAFSLHNLGTLALDRGRPEEAEAHHREALAIRRAAYGEKNPRTAWSHDGLGTALGALGRGEEALSHLQTALEVRRATLGADHPHIRRSLRLLGESHRDAGDLAAAARLFQEALAAGPPREPDSAEPDPSAAEMAVDLAEVLLQSGRVDEVAGAVAEAESRMAEDQKDELTPRLESIREKLGT
ncbi:MAG: tetratricopeptide repeat protein, partial [Acidobacteriota bacterium]